MYFNIGTKLRHPKEKSFNIGTKLTEWNTKQKECFRSMYFNIGQKIKFVQFDKKGNINNV